MPAVPRLDSGNLSFDRYDANAPFCIDPDATTYNSGSDELEVVIGPGRARWPDDVVYELTADQTTFTFASPAASTTYHVWLTDGEGSPTIEVDTTAPAGDNSRTYIGSVTTASDTSVSSTDDQRGLLPLAASAIPVGALMPYGGGNAPSGWLLCDGSDVSRTTYADLFSAIGTAFGVGDGSTTFTLPDLRGRVVLGVDDMGGSSANRITDSSADAIGGTGGVEDVTLSNAQMPSHSHSGSVFVSISGTTDSDTHSHGDGSLSIQNVFDLVSDVAVGGAAERHKSFGADTDFQVTGFTDNDAHSHSFSGSGSDSFVTSSAGSDAAHTNVQPYQAMTYIIRY